MAKKHFDEYYNNIAKAYVEQNQLLKKMIDELEKGNIDEERLELFKNNMTVVVNNFATVTYIKFLLDLPTRKQKHSKFTKQHKKLLDSLDPKFTPEQAMKDNEAALQRLKDLIE